MKMLEKNIHSTLTLLTETEKQVKAEIEERFFKPLSQRHWEGVDVERYWKELEIMSYFHKPF